MPGILNFTTPPMVGASPSATPDDSPLTVFQQSLVVARDESPARRARHINSLPREVLELIFSFTVVQHYEDREWRELGYGVGNRQRQAAPFRLATVCRNWRVITLGYGALWNYVWIPEPMTWTHGVHASDFVNLVLDRSGVAPLSVLIPWDTPSGDQHPECASMKQLHRCINLLCEHSERWARLEFRGPLCSVSEAIVHKLLRRPTPALKQLSVRYTRGDLAQIHGKPVYAQVPSMFPSSANLEVADVILEHCASLEQPMLHLHTLTLDVPSIPVGLYDLLAMTPNLRRLALQGTQSVQREQAALDAENKQPDDWLVLEDLEYIYVSASHLFLPLGIFTRLGCLPNLTEVDLPWGMTWSNPDDVVGLVSFFAEHGEGIRSITFREDRGLDWWTSTPLEEQRMIADGPTEFLWEQLSEPDQDGKYLLPNLQILRFEGIVFFPREGAVFREFDEARCRGRRGAFAQLDVLWFPSDDLDASFETFCICAAMYELPLNSLQWEEMLDQGSAANGGNVRYFASSRYLTLGLEKAF
ncbi:hypothetical protein AURDEDRAFT_166912 [Auricularia subglabra TFB-10046 SS5]|nr:hypothetical protein AURDEDRAFT_166912 [Auricularia subglabra TFB-10046 SS5]